MILENYSLDKLKQQILDIVSKHLNSQDFELFFFGSRVTNTNSENSDIDIGIQSKTQIDSIAMGKIKEDINNLPVLYKIDIVDFGNVTDKFKSVALQNISYIKK